MLPPGKTFTGPAVPCPYAISKLATPSPLGVMVTSPVLSWVMVNIAPNFADVAVVCTKETSSLISFLHPENVAMSIKQLNMYFNVFILFNSIDYTMRLISSILG